MRAEYGLHLQLLFDITTNSTRLNYCYKTFFSRWKFDFPPTLVTSQLEASKRSLSYLYLDISQLY